MTAETPSDEQHEPEPEAPPEASSSGLWISLFGLVALLAFNMMALWLALWVFAPMATGSLGSLLLRGLLSLVLTGAGFLAARLSVGWTQTPRLRAFVSAGLGVVYLLGGVVLRQAGVRPLVLYPGLHTEQSLTFARIFAASVVNAAVVLTLAYGALAIAAWRDHKAAPVDEP